MELRKENRRIDLREKKGKISQMEERLGKIESYLSPKEKKPNFKKLFKKRLISQAKRKLKKGWAFVIVIKENGTMSPSLVQIKDEMIYVKETNTWHDASSQNILWWDKYPILLQPQWDVVPISPAMYGKNATEEGRLATSQKVYIHATKGAELKSKALQGKAIMWIIIGVVAILYLLSELLK